MKIIFYLPKRERESGFYIHFIKQATKKEKKNGIIFIYMKK